MKRFLLFPVILTALLGCRGTKPAPVDELAVPKTTPVITEAPAKEVELELAAPIGTPSPTPAPLPTHTPAPSPTPTATPTPSPTPDPYEGAERVTYSKDERFFYVTLTEELKERITGISYPAPGQSCRVPYEDLRYVRLMYVNFENEEQEGELMVHRLVADDVLDIFYTLYTQRYPLACVRLVDDYGEVADDNLSMADNNTSSFCYRQVTGSRKLSWHSFGAAIDINPVQNPYINGKRVSPPEGREYLNRKDKRPDMIDHSDLCYKTFKAHGWKWGGDFSGDKDYQHFYKELNVKR